MIASSAAAASGYFGFALKNKMLEDLLAAVRGVAETGTRIRLVFMTGFDRTEGAYGATIRKLMDAAPLRRLVIETGFLEPREASRCLWACDFAALLFRDGASFRRSSILAAMAHGLPVVSCSSGPVPSGLSNGINILLGPAGDTEALAKQMLRLCREPDLRQEMAAASLRTARQFAWPAIAARTIELYRTLL